MTGGVFASTCRAHRHRLDYLSQNVDNRRSAEHRSNPPFAERHVMYKSLRPLHEADHRSEESPLHRLNTLPDRLGLHRNHRKR